MELRRYGLGFARMSMGYKLEYQSDWSNLLSSHYCRGYPVCMNDHQENRAQIVESSLIVTELSGQ